MSLKFALEYDKPLPTVKFNKFVINDMDLEPCSVNPTNCRYHTKYHGRAAQLQRAGNSC